MHLDDLPTEIVTSIYLSLPDIASVHNLASTCYRFNKIFHSSKRLAILTSAADAEFGPLDDILQLLTQNASQAAHVQRHVPMNEALLHQVVHTGRVAQRYASIYPFKKWKHDYAQRRLLTANETFTLRRAIYRLWLFDRAFHTSAHVRTCRGRGDVVRERAALLQNFTLEELAEMWDVHYVVLRDIVANNIFPSNGRMRQKFAKRFPDGAVAGGYQSMISIHLNYPPPARSTFDGNRCLSDQFYQTANFHGTTKRNLPFWHEPSLYGWGDDITHYYVIEDMMKLDPEQILDLRDNYASRADVETYVREMGEWFVNNGETFSETLAVVVKGRGVELEDFKGAVEGGEVGVAMDVE